jgi:hypothetical protein
VDYGPRSLFFVCYTRRSSNIYLDIFTKLYDPSPPHYKIVSCNKCFRVYVPSAVLNRSQELHPCSAFKGVFASSCVQYNSTKGALQMSPHKKMTVGILITFLAFVITVTASGVSSWCHDQCIGYPCAKCQFWRNLFYRQELLHFCTVFSNQGWSSEQHFMSSGTLWCRVVLTRTTWRLHIAFFIVTAVKTSNLTTLEIVSKARNPHWIICAVSCNDTLCLVVLTWRYLWRHNVGIGLSTQTWLLCCSCTVY